MVRLILLSLIQSLLLCGGQMLLKVAVLHMDKTLSWGAFFVRSVLMNGWLLGCGVLMTGAGLLWMYILRHFPFASAYPLTALSFVFGTLGAMCFFHEAVHWQHWLGIVFILAGCFLVAK